MRSTQVKGLWWGALWGAIASIAAGAHAQDRPDVRNIQPFVMLVVDSSGSMEEVPDCPCASEDDCSNCIPDCDLNNILGEPPPGKKNRWAVTLEALTGKFIDFECEPLERTAENGMTYDLDYAIRYHQPWTCSGGSCPYPGPSIQTHNGILDTYQETLQFGLLTFDGDYTYKGASQQIAAGDFSTSLSEGIEGMWSYGGTKPYRYPGCATSYVVDSGARSEAATEGGLISLGSSSCASPPCDQYELNAAIQDALLRTRPYGGTPIAASLDDLYTHLQGMTDPYKACRKRYGILITDGAPDPDFRDLDCDCGTGTKGACPALGAGEDPYSCPYPLAKDAAQKLVQGGAADEPKQLDRLFVLGMSVNDATRDELNAIAAYGGNTVRPDGNYALFADDPAVMRANLDSVFSSLLEPTSRSVPAFATGKDGTQYQISTGFRVSAEAAVDSLAPPWVGVIERRRFVCDANGELESPDLDATGTGGDFFANVLNAQPRATRDLWSVVPAVGGVTTAAMKGAFTRGDSVATCGATYCEKRKIEASTFTNALFGVAADADRSALIDWMYGTAGTIRAARKLGDIYHSSPTTVGPPLDEPGHEAYSLFRDQPAVANRPLVLYVGSNDGVLHAFSVENVEATETTRALSAGEQIWGFVPPMFIDKLNDSLTAHQFLMDGTPVVKDVFYKRETEATETQYHTVLISGMRKGGKGYVALDVTDPFEPEFLWQFTAPEMGYTYGQPEIVQATFKFAARQGESESVQTRAVAILPGGVNLVAPGTTGPGCVDSFGYHVLSMRRSGSPFTSRKERTSAVELANHRASVPCRSEIGRVLYFVDVETGKLIKKIYDDDDDHTNGLILPSPIVGSPAAYLDAVGAIATRGFVMDADGVMWRFDMSAEDPKPDDPLLGWTMRPFHDLFWDYPKEGGQTSYEKPILSIDAEANVVVLVGTGDTDKLESPDADNRVVSLTELATVAEPSTAEHWQALINWELRSEGADGGALARSMVKSELVTGAMALFEGQLFVPTFIPDAGTGDVCDFGRGRMWSLHYQERDTAHVNQNVRPDGSTGTPPGTYGPQLVAVAGSTGTADDPTPADNQDVVLFNQPPAKARDNLLIQGLGTVQRNSCVAQDDSLLESYFTPQLPSMRQSATPPQIWIVGQASQDRAPMGGSQLGDIGAGIGRAVTFSRMTSWASSVD